MAPMRPYYAERGLSAAFYDTVTAADALLEGDLAIYAGLAPRGGTVLDLGAGTGRLTLALAEHGFSAVGVEIAPAMLAQAQARREELSPEAARRVEFRVGGGIAGPTQPVLVVMLLTLPPWVAVIAVVFAALLDRVPDYVSGRMHPDHEIALSHIAARNGQIFGWKAGVQETLFHRFGRRGSTAG